MTTTQIRIAAAIAALAALVGILAATTDTWRDGTVDPAVFTQEEAP